MDGFHRLFSPVRPIVVNSRFGGTCEIRTKNVPEHLYGGINALIVGHGARHSWPWIKPAVYLDVSASACSLIDPSSSQRRLWAQIGNVFLGEYFSWIWLSTSWSAEADPCGSLGFVGPNFGFPEDSWICGWMATCQLSQWMLSRARR